MTATTAAAARVFRIRSGEGPLVLHAFSLYVTIGLGFALGRTAADTLFLSRVGVEFLPHMFLLSGVALVAGGAVYAAAVERLGPRRLFMRLLAAVMGVLGLVWIGCRINGDALAYVALFLAYAVASELLIAQFNQYTSGFVDALQAKRLLPLISAGARLGGVLGGLAAALLLLWLPVDVLILGWMVTCAASIAVIARYRPQDPDPPPRETGRRAAAGGRLSGFARALRLARGSALMRAICAGMFLMVLLMMVMDYVVNTVLTRHLADERELGRFFATFGATAHGLTLLGQSLLTGRLLERFGYRVVNLIYPLSTLLAFLALAISPGYWSAVAGRLNYVSMLAVFRNPSANLAYMALPPYMRGRARALATGLMLPLGMAAAGLLLVLVPVEHVTGWLVWAGTALALLYLGVKVRQTRSYREALHELIMQKVFAGETGGLESQGRLDRVIVARLGRQLAGGCDAAQAVAIIDLLRHGEPQAASAVLLSAAPGLPDALQDRILRLLADLDACDWRDYARDCLGRGDAHLRSTAFLLLVRGRGDVGMPQAEGWIGGASPRLAAAAATAMLDSADPSRRLTGRDFLQDLLRSEDEGRILAGLATLGRVGDDAWADALAPLHRHPSARVRAQAVFALGAMASRAPERFVSYLMHAAQDPAPQVRAAMLRHGLAAVGRHERWSIVARGLLDGDHEVRGAAAAAVGAHLPADADELRHVLESASRHFELHHAVCAALSARRPPGADELVAAARGGHVDAGWLKRDLARWLDQSPAAARIAEPPVRSFIATVLREEAHRHGEAALAAAEAGAGRRGNGALRAAAVAEDRQLRALALESLQQGGEAGVDRRLLELLQQDEPATAEEAPSPTWDLTLRTPGALLEWCSEHGSAWLRECASALLAQPRPGQA